MENFCAAVGARLSHGPWTRAGRLCQTLRFNGGHFPAYVSRMAAALFRYRHRVTYAECTVGNHVYYARYLDLLEAARGAFFRELGASLFHWQESGVIFPVVECRLRYKSPARYDDVLTVEVWPTAIGRVRLNFAYRITNRKAAVILEADTCHACAGLDEKPKRLPKELVERLRPRLRSDGSED